MITKKEPEKQPLVSIILPTFNNEKTIRDCVTTLLNQTYTNKEIIIINDGSTDRTGEILRNIVAPYQSVKVITKAHEGVTKTRNIGLMKAQGEVVFFGEADAIYKAYYLEKAVSCLFSEEQIGGVCVLGEPWKTRSTLVTDCIELENLIKHKLLKEGKMQPHFAWVFRKEVFDNVGEFDVNLFQGEDKDIFIRVKKAGYKIGLVEGMNWSHLRNKNTFQFISECYRRGRSRILFTIKHRNHGDFVRNIGIPWLMVLLLPISVFFPLLVLLLAVTISLGFIYKLIDAIRLGWDCTHKKKYVLLLPIFQIIRYLSSSLGYTHGLLNWFSNRLKGRHADWSNI